MSDESLNRFVERALRAGATRDEVTGALRAAGWPGEEVETALAHYADVDFVVPVPKPRAQPSASDAFRYLVMFVTLCMAAFHLGQLLFQFVNLAIPDPLSSSRGGVVGQIRLATAVLLVAYPVFLYTSWRISGETGKDPTRRNSAVRRWLTYATLFIAAIIIVGDLVSLVYGVLAGDLTLRFLLKSTIVAAIAAAVFGYYLWLMRSDDRVLAR